MAAAAVRDLRGVAVQGALEEANRGQSLTMKCLPPRRKFLPVIDPRLGGFSTESNIRMRI